MATVVRAKLRVSISAMNTNAQTPTPAAPIRYTGLRPEPVGQGAPHRDGGEVHDCADEDGAEHERLALVVAGHQVAGDDDREDVVRDVLGEAGTHRGEDLAGVGPEHLEDRQRLAARHRSAFRASALAWAALKTGDSSTCSRTYRPMMTSTAESRNGMRQPQARKASSDWNAARMASSPFASSWPPGAPACGQLAQNPRRALSPCSETISTAPPHSPPRAKPWTRRSSTSRTGARVPTWSNVGSAPMRNVETPIIIRLSTRSFLRPSLSPK